MPLIKRNLQSTANSTGFLSLGCNPTPSRVGEFVFSNSPTHTGANQFSYLVCENYTEGSNFGSSPNPTGYLYLNLDNSYSSQGWFIKNDIIAVGENSDGTTSEYFNAESRVFIFSEGNSNFQLIQPILTENSKSQSDFYVELSCTSSGIKYQFSDSLNTKMKWTSKIEVIQNMANQKTTQFSFQNILQNANSGLLPPDINFNNSSNDAVVMDAGGDVIDGQSYNYIDAGSDDA